MDSKRLYNWFLNRLTYAQTFFIICVIFLISLLPIAYFWVEIHLAQIAEINSELTEITEEFLLKNLITQIGEHRFLAQRFLSGDTNYQARLDESGEQIRHTLREILKISESTDASSPIRSDTLWQRIDPKRVLGKWQTLVQHSDSPLSVTASEILHTTLIQYLQVELAYLTGPLRLGNNEQEENYLLANNITLRIPFIQENLSLLTLLIGEYLLDKDIVKQQERINLLKDRIGFDLTYLNNTVDKIQTRSTTPFIKLFSQSWKDYYDSVNTTLSFIQNHETIDTSSPELFEEFINLSQKSQLLSTQLWERSLDELRSVFLNEKAAVNDQLWFVLILTCILGLIAFVLGTLATRLANKRLLQLTRATESLTNGDFAVRVSDSFHDEIGKQAQAFNRMAQKIEEMIGFLYELLHATTDLANGNLSARLTQNHRNQEFNQVAQSFNHMAEIFEAILDKLQQLVVTLTNSATEITSSSQGQEAMIVEQEKTTKNIAHAAQDISTTSKSFAISMNEMGQDANQASILATTGKEALIHMQNIMHRMVNSSGHISSSLTTLNNNAQNITSIVTTITKVADQTNLLSLNASIEAEKAGEYGRGFAVIAREIRRLADQTATSTLDIEKIIDEIMHAVSSTVVAVNDFTRDIHQGVDEIGIINTQQTQIIEQVQAFISKFEDTNKGMQTQSQGAEKIYQAIMDLSEKAQRATVANHRLHQTIDGLQLASSALQRLAQSLHRKDEVNTKNSVPEINVDLK